MYLVLLSKYQLLSKIVEWSIANSIPRLLALRFLNKAFEGIRNHILCINLIDINTSCMCCSSPWPILVGPQVTVFMAR